MKNESYSLTICETSSKISFTAKYPEIVNSIILDCVIFSAPKEIETHSFQKTAVKVLFDTGATETYMMLKTALKLNLVSPKDLPNNWKKNCIIMLELPSKLKLPIEVIIARDIPDVDMVIGASVFAQADSFIKNSGGQTTFSMDMLLEQKKQPNITGPVFSVMETDEEKKSFKISYDDIVNRIEFSCRLIAGYEVDFRIFAIIDTAAERSLIPRQITNRIDPLPLDARRIYEYNGSYKSQQYPVIVELPGGSRHEVSAFENNIGDNILIGMDILRKSDFSIQNLSGQTVFSFNPIGASGDSMK